MEEERILLKHKTRGNSTVREKAKVYFSYHHEDFGYFDHISDQILDKQDCAIYYYDYSEGQPDFEELKMYLSEMQLFVVPVTTNYLDRNCNAYDREFSFAMENHIPILPLLQNSDVSFKKRFGERCAKIQYLDENQCDNTKIPFEQKLENFLSSVLISDEDINRIKKAFDAHIFLSYRKKDRAYANDLMRTIHSDEEFRNVAIWYDEFLDTGKDYRESIQKEIENSDLVMLLVTPSLLEIDNYIMKQEYPEACKNNKHILPIESVETDRSLLEKYYLQMPECVNVNNREAVTVALRSGLLLKTGAEKETSEHRFLIGLAYLKGVDVERDPETATALIKEAADMGCIEAVKTLRNMYKTGQGVEKNDQRSIGLHKELVRLLEEKYQKDDDEQILDELLQEAMDLGDDLMRLGETKQSEHLYTKVIVWSGKYTFRNDHKGKIITIKLLTALGEMAEQKGDFRDAREYYHDSLTKAYRLYEELETSTDIKNAEYISLEAELKMWLSISYEHMGDIERKLKNHTEAKEYYKSALILTKNACDENKTIPNMHDLFVAYDKLFGVDIREGVFEEALEYYMSTLGERDRLAKEARSEEICGDLSIAYNRLGFIRGQEGLFKMNRGDYQGALLSLEDAFSYVTKQEDSCQKRLKIGELYYRMAICMLQNGEKTSCVIRFLENAEKWLISAESICETDSISRGIDQYINDIGRMIANLA